MQYELANSGCGDNTVTSLGGTPAARVSRIKRINPSAQPAFQHLQPLAVDLKAGRYFKTTVHRVRVLN